MDHHNQRKTVLAGVIEMDTKFLIAQRSYPAAFDGIWEFPGGKAEPGETDEQALARELFEELGITIHGLGKKLCSTPFDHQGTPMTLVVYLINSFSGTPEAREHKALAWVSKEELSGYQFPEPDLEAIALLQQ